MLTLYYKVGCPFCNRVLAELDNLELEFDRKDIADDAVAAELVERGGKRMVPYLVDEAKEVEMYESEDIVKYLKENYGTSNDSTGEGKPRVHMSDSTCVSCEG